MVGEAKGVVNGNDRQPMWYGPVIPESEDLLPNKVEFGPHGNYRSLGMEDRELRSVLGASGHWREQSRYVEFGESNHYTKVRDNAGTPHGSVQWPVSESSRGEMKEKE